MHVQSASKHLHMCGTERVRKTIHKENELRMNAYRGHSIQHLLKDTVAWMSVQHSSAESQYKSISAQENYRAGYGPPLCAESRLG